MLSQRNNSSQITEQQRNRLVQWEMEYGHPLELDEDLRDAYEVLYGGGGR